MKKQTKETENRFSKSFEGKQILKKFTQRLVVANRSGQTVKSYMRAIEFLMDFHDGAPSSLEINQVNAAVKKAGLRKGINLHIFRHCFASHSLEEGMDIKPLQYLMGHSSVQTTMVYLHISEAPLHGGFSPLDKWEEK